MKKFSTVKVMKTAHSLRKSAAHRFNCLLSEISWSACLSEAWRIVKRRIALVWNSLESATSIVKDAEEKATSAMIEAGDHKMKARWAETQYRLSMTLQRVYQAATFSEPEFARKAEEDVKIEAFFIEFGVYCY